MTKVARLAKTIYAVLLRRIRQLIIPRIDGANVGSSEQRFGVVRSPSNRILCRRRATNGDNITTHLAGRPFPLRWLLP